MMDRLQFTYTNHRGVTEVRTVTPQGVEWGSNTWHPEPCWLLRAYCHDRDDVRTFEMRRMVPCGDERPAGCDDKTMSGLVALADFGQSAIDTMWDQGGIDESDIQEIAARGGVIVNVGYDPDSHSDNHGVCPEAGDDWWEMSSGVKAALDWIKRKDLR
jgi:hypothetical protein